jgi:hypothetical protein
LARFFHLPGAFAAAFSVASTVAVAKASFSNSSVHAI